jgi:hypothetical protein
MKIDLQTVKIEIETEVQQLEKRRSVLQEQMTHLEAVQRIASELTGSGKIDRLEADDEDQAVGAADGTG